MGEGWAAALQPGVLVCGRLCQALYVSCISSPLLLLAEVEETLKRLQSQKGVQGIIVVNTEGIPIKSTMDNPTTTQYASLMHSFILKARSTVREIDPQNDLTFLRIRSKKNEIMVAPDKDYFLIVIQNPTE
uniref:Dynein light chain roadblock-type 1 n=2 Tax=Rhinopithecus TaxID=542827 RepID=A0A2K6MN09_RHIBE